MGKIDFLFAVVVLIAASNYVFCKQALVHVPPFALLSVRYLAALITISLLMLPRRYAISKPMLLKSLLLGLVLAVAAISWQFGLMGADHIGPAAFIVSLDGLMVPILAGLIFGDRLSLKVMVAIPIAVIGLSMLTLREGMSVSSSDLWFIVSAFGFSLHIVLTHRYSKLFDPVCLSWGQVLVVCVLASFFTVQFEREAVTLANLAVVKYQVLYLALVATAFRFPLQNYVQKRMSASRAGFLFVSEPVVVALLGALVFAESLSLQQWLGCVIILAAVVLSNEGTPAKKAVCIEPQP